MYRRMIHWLDREMLGKEMSFIEDEIAERLDNYKWALKKHGIKTLIGTISSMLSDKDALLGASAAFAAIKYAAGQDLAALLAAVSILGANLAVKTASVLLEREEIRRGPGSEVAFVHEVERRLGG